MEAQQLQQNFTVEKIINVLRTLKKTDSLFKPLKKLKGALQKTNIKNISKVPTKTILLYHFGLGSQIDLQLILKTKYEEYQCVTKNPIIPGKAYTYLKFNDQKFAQKYIFQFEELVKDYCWYLNQQHINSQKIVIVMYWNGQIQGMQEQIDIQDCSSKFDPNKIPGIVLQQNFLSKEQSEDIMKQIDSKKWNKLNNRRVQHYGYQFKYGENGIDKQNGKMHNMPQWAVKILNKFQQKYPQIVKENNGSFDQLTVNDYFAGDGIPPHFDTHSPFQQKFIAISLLSGIVMNWRKFDGNQQPLYLVPNSMMIFSGQARFAWTHGISCRKLDKVDHQLVHRSRRVSLTFRKIRFKPCQCKYYFYCDSQGYDQNLMKKNNWLLQKYFHQNRRQKLQQMDSHKIQKYYVDEAYNGFGYNFDNHIIKQIKILLQKDSDEKDFVLDVGCGNSTYRKLLNNKCHYFAVQRCKNMKGQDQYQQRLFMDCKSIAFKDQTFDKVLLIAVLHHLSTLQGRIKCIKQCLRVLKKEGSLYLTVFSYSKKKKDIYSSQDILLDYCLPKHKIKQTQNEKQNNNKDQNTIITKQEAFKNSKGDTYTRYYHLFEIEQLKNIIKSANGQIIQIQQDDQNLIAKIRKI